MIAANIIISTGFAIMKGAYNQGFIVSDFNFIRGLIGLIILTPIMHFKGHRFLASVPADKRKIVFLVAAFTSFGIFFFN